MARLWPCGAQITTRQGYPSPPTFSAESIFKNWSLNATYFFKNEVQMSKADQNYDRFQLDLTAKF